MKILLIHPFGIGDVIFSLAAAEALTRAGHEVAYLCNERTQELLDLCPSVRKTHRFDRAQIRGDLQSGRWLRAAGRYAGLRRELAAERYDAALDFSMGREYAFLALCAGIRRRAGWDYKGRGFWLTHRVRVEGFDERSPRDFAMDLARMLDPRADGDPSYPDLALGTSGALSKETSMLEADLGRRSWLVVAPGGGASWGADAHYKQWPKESWIELTCLLARDSGLPVVVLGSREEETLVREVAAASETHSAAGVTAMAGAPIKEVLALLAGARAFVGTDGGLVHLANLAGTPVVGIYGPVSETGYGPLETASPARVVTADVPCRPCYRRFRFTGCAHRKSCLTSIRAERVAAEVRALLTPDSL